VETFEQRLRDLGLSRDEWQQLKVVVLESSYGHTMRIPEALATHEVAVLVAEYQRTGNRKALHKAAARLVGSSDTPFLALDKS